MNLNEETALIGVFSQQNLYKTLSSINNTPEYSIFKPLIDFTDSFYENLVQNNLEKCTSILINYINNIKETNDLSLYYCIKSIFHFININPKNIKIIIEIFQFIQEYFQSTYSNSFALTSAIEENIHKYQKYSLQYSNIPQLFLNQNKITETQIDSLISIYPKDSLELFLKDDDLESLKFFMNTNNSFSTKYLIVIGQNSPLSFVKTKPASKEVNLLDFCAFYGSHNCFKYLCLEGFQLTNSITNFSIAGGNSEIIHIIEQNSIPFNSCFRTSIQYHHFHLSEWLLSNYKCEMFPLSECLHFCDYRAFLFLLLNGVPPFFTEISSLYLICDEEKVNAKAIELLLENEHDPNYTFTYPSNYKQQHDNDVESCLYALCKSQNTNLEALEILLEYGADVNFGEKKPIFELCSHSKTKSEALKLLLDHKADVNSYYRKYRGTPFQTPLALLCHQDTQDSSSIKLLIDYGANINKGEEDERHKLIRTPIQILCSKENPNYEGIKILIEHGADFSNCLYLLCSSNSSNGSVINQINIKNSKTDLLSNYQNNFKAMKLIIEKGCDVNQIFNNITPLFALCSKFSFRLDAIELLLKNGADPNKGIMTPLYALCSNNNGINIQAIQLLIKYHADVNKEYNKRTPLCALFFNKEINLEAINLLLDNGADVNKGSCSPLFTICSQTNPNIEIIKKLIQKGANINSLSETTQKVTPIYALCRQQTNINLEIIKLLIENGADLNLGLRTPIFALSSHNEINFEAIKLLIENGADINKECNSHTPFYALCSNESINVEIINYFIHKNVNLNQEDNGRTPLFALLTHKNPNIEIIKLLIENGADLNKGKKTPLSYVLSQEIVNMKLLKFLVDNGADVSKESEENIDQFETPLYILCKRELIDHSLLKFLLDNGADIDKGLLNDKKAIIETPIFALCNRKIISNEDIKLLADRGADVNIECYGMTPLSTLCTKNNVPISLIQQLLSKGADPNKGDKLPLHILCSKKFHNIEHIKLLITYGANINIENDNQTILFKLCSEQKPDINLIKLLIEKGADVNKGHQDNDGKTIITPLFAACNQETVYLELIQLLIRNGADVNKKCFDKSPLVSLFLKNDFNYEAIQLLIDNGAIIDQMIHKIAIIKKDNKLISLTAKN